MSQTIDDRPTGAADPFRLERPMNPVVRWVLAVSGLFCIVVPAWQLRLAFFELGWWTIFFGLIVVGAWSVGIPFLKGALLGDSETWTFDGGALRIERVSPWRGRRVAVFRAADIVRTEVSTTVWDSRANSYSVELHVRSGERLETADYGTLAKAEEIRGEILRRLGVARDV
jgi:uncharacterized membrane protein YdbT with pleckstrin-like domain